MRAGALRNRIQILSQPMAQDASGQLSAAVGPPQLVLATSAAIRTATSKEIYTLGAGFDGQVTHAITIRCPGAASMPSTGMTIAFTDALGRSRSFLVQVASDPTERGREVDIFALEQTK